MILLKSLIKKPGIIPAHNHNLINEEQDLEAEKRIYLRDETLKYQMYVNYDYKRLMVDLVTLSSQIARKANAATPFKARGQQVDLNDEQLCRLLADSLRSIDSRQFNQNPNANIPKFVTIPIDPNSRVINASGMFRENFVFKILLTPNSEGDYDADIDFTKNIPEMRSFTVSILDLYKHMNEVTLKFTQAAEEVHDNIDLTRRANRNNNQPTQNNNQQNQNESSTHGDISKPKKKIDILACSTTITPILSVFPVKG